MDVIVIRGGRALSGEVSVGGAKNSSLPLLFASLLTAEPCRLENVPQVVDVRTTGRLLGQMGVRVETAADAVTLEASNVESFEAPYELVKTMRASFLALGPLLARFGRARVATPGGCAIGSRPVNLHLAGLEQMGARISLSHGYVEAEAPRSPGVKPRLRGAHVVLESPSVGATENLMLAATLAQGTSVIDNAAREPEIVDLGEALQKMGAIVRGAGSPTIEIDGVDALGGFAHRVIPDRIEAGTLLMAVAAARGDVLVRGAVAEHLTAVIAKLIEAGVEIEEEPGGLRVRTGSRLRSVDVRTAPYPGFPTDLQAQMMAVMCCADGGSVITETIFENRFMHVQELARMGADIRVEGGTALVRGVPALEGAPVMATDLRASVCLVVAALAAANTTRIQRVYHLDRGYERLEAKLGALGAEIERVPGAAVPALPAVAAESAASLEARRARLAGRAANPPAAETPAKTPVKKKARSRSIRRVKGGG
jgi:UDP-N-acetylglucosamine 1-carboxyvinyltransferase